MKISQLDVLTACWHTAQHNSDYSIYNHRTTKTNQKYPSVNL